MVDINGGASQKSGRKSYLNAKAKTVERTTIKTSINNIVQIGNTLEFKYF